MAGPEGTERSSGKGRRSRRELLAGAVGALGVLGAETLLRATPAQAGLDGDVVLGDFNSSGSTTVISTGGSDQDALHLSAGFGTALSAGNNSPGGTLNSNPAVWGQGQNNPGLRGDTFYSAAGVVGIGNNNTEGVYAQSGTTPGSSPGETRNGVHGVTNSPNDSGVVGENVGGGFGTKGVTTSATQAGVIGVNNGAGVGVRGQSSGGTGVRGDSNSGGGVEGIAGGSAIGVYGQGGGGGGNGVQGYAGASSAVGVFGVNVFGGTGIVGASDAAGGIGIRGEGAAVGIRAQVTGSGVALDVQGPAQFSRSGKVVIPSGKKTATVTPPGGLTSASLVMALMQNVTGGVMVKAAVPNPGAGTFQITLNKAPLSPATATVAWFVVN